MQLLLNEMADRYIRENFKRLLVYLGNAKILKGEWRFVEITISGPVTNLKYPHGLSFTPKDVIPTSVIGAGSVTWNFANFDGVNLDLTASDSCTVRAFIGAYQESSQA